jgi:hypothetical protein
MQRTCRGICKKTKDISKFPSNGKYILYTCKICQDEKNRVRMAKNYVKVER